MKANMRFWWAGILGLALVKSCTLVREIRARNEEERRFQQLLVVPAVRQPERLPYKEVSFEDLIPTPAPKR